VHAHREQDTGTITACKAASVIGDHAIVVGDGRLGTQREVGIGKNAAVDQQQRLPRALHLVLQVRTIQIYTLHQCSPLLELPSIHASS
jgi:hypothetical protein